MNAYELIINKQIDWATRRGIQLIGSKGERGRKAYTQTLDQNLFEPLSDEARISFEQADGNELEGSLNSPSKMQAVHSSSALGINIFHYWGTIGRVSEIATFCGSIKPGESPCQNIQFEDKYPIPGVNRIPPNIDVVIHNHKQEQFQRFAVECKFSEAYASQRHGGLKSAYLNEKEIWMDLPNLRHLAEGISPEDSQFQYLHAAQLVKHILGLKARFEINQFKLLYLWYDVPLDEGNNHRKEIEDYVPLSTSLHVTLWQHLACLAYNPISHLRLSVF